MEKLNTASLVIIESFVSQTPNGKSKVNFGKRNTLGTIHDVGLLNFDCKKRIRYLD